MKKEIHCKNKEIVNIKQYYNSKHWNDLTELYINSELSKKCFKCKTELDKYNINFIHRNKIRIGKEKLLDIIPICSYCRDYIDTKENQSKKKSERLQLHKYGFNEKKLSDSKKEYFLSIIPERRGVALSKYYVQKTEKYKPSSNWINNQVKKTCKWIKSYESKNEN
jgi:hypothetical protein